MRVLDTGKPYCGLQTRRGAQHIGMALVCVWLCLCAPVLADNSLDGLPVVSVHVGGNRTFLWDGVPLDYQVIVSTADGRDTLAGTIDSSQVAVAFEYMASGYESFVPPAIDGLALAAIVRGRTLIAASNCVLCHTVSGARPIPSYTTIAALYKGNAGATDLLAAKVIAGGKGVWGDTVMPPHPELSPTQAKAMVRYILALSQPWTQREWLAVRGAVTADYQAAGASRGPFGAMAGRYVLWATYTDHRETRDGSKTGRVVSRFRHPLLLATERHGDRDVSEAPAPGGGGTFVVAETRRAFIRFDSIDLTDVRELSLTVGDSRSDWAGGSIEVRLGTAVGPVIGRTQVVSESTEPSTQTVSIRLTPTRGAQDLYLVFRGGRNDRKGSVALGAVAFRH